jgi:hypothetical protein
MSRAVRCGLVVAAAALGCGQNASSPSGGVGQDGSGAPGDASGDASTSADGASRDAAGADTGRPTDGGPAGRDGSGGEAAPPVMGGPGCGLASAAFCETFDAPAASQGRAGELDTRYWGAGRLDPQLPTGNGVAFGIGPSSMLPTCRAGLPATVLPDQDAVICDANSAIASPHLLVSTAAQNYGQNSYRIRQPFDFAGRTGTIVFDAEGYIENALLGWISVEVTEDPINAPCFAIGGSGVYNDEGSLIPENGVEIQFQNTCAGYAQPPTFSLSMIDVIQEYQQTTMSPATPVCLATQQGSLNHFEISISQTQISVQATPLSADGMHFDAPMLLYQASVNLPFSRGYVQITTHNHATIKYSDGNSMDSWIARWDNVGFDGPVLSNWREYEVPDSLLPGTGAWNRSGPVVSVGYRVADVAQGPAQTMTIHGVDLTSATSARLSFSGYYLNDASMPIANFALQFRFNGKAWIQRPLTAGEVGVLTGGNNQGILGQMLDVPLSDLVSGDNTLEVVSVNVPQSYPPAVLNMDLVLGTQ